MPKTDITRMIMLGAEGCTEVANFPWIREASPEESQDFFTIHPKLSGIDGIGRPYWVMVLEDAAPLWACDIVKRKIRTVHFE